MSSHASSLFTAILLVVSSTFRNSAMPSVHTPDSSKPLTLDQVWSLNSTYTDRQRGVAFRYPSVWKAATQFGYHPPALARPDFGHPAAGFAYVEGGFPRNSIVGPYAGTNLEGVGFVYSVFPVASAVECKTKAASLAGNSLLDNSRVNNSGHSSVKIAGQRYSVYRTGDAGMSQYISGKLYATYTKGSCYLFETGVAAASTGALEGIQALTPAQVEDINLHLWNMMKTVRIVRPK